MTNETTSAGTAGQTGSGSAAALARSAVATAKTTVRDAAGQVRQEAEQILGQARDRAETVLGDHKSAAADQVTSIAGAIRAAADQMNEQGGSTAVVQYAGQAADGLERLAMAMRDRNLGSLLTDVQDFARRQPALFFGGAVLTGFLVARFLKSSAEVGQESGTGQGADTSRGAGESLGGQSVTYGSSAGASGAGPSPRGRRAGTGGSAARYSRSNTAQGYAQSSYGGAGSTGADETDRGGTSS